MLIMLECSKCAQKTTIVDQVLLLVSLQLALQLTVRVRNYILKTHPRDVLASGRPMATGSQGAGRWMSQPGRVPQVAALRRRARAA